MNSRATGVELRASSDLTSPADQATVRRMNLALLMRNLTAGRPRSRARLAHDTGLNKATVSSLVGELTERGLVTEGPVTSGAVGRPGRVVQVDTGLVRCIGMEINVGHVSGMITDLNGRMLAQQRLDLPVGELGPVRALAYVADVARSLVGASGSTSDQVETLYLSLPGMIDVAAGVLSLAPNLHWREVDVVHGILGRLRWPGLRVAVDNDANLGAMAEYAAGRSAGTAQLLYLVGDIGVGAGLIMDGRIIRGATGFAGEAGHMPIGPPENVCGCGRLGCWETVIGLQSLISADADDGVEAATSPFLRNPLPEIVAHADAGRPRTLAALTEMGRWLGIGSSVLANLLDPEVIVYGGHFAALAKYLLPSLQAEMGARVVNELTSCRLEFSTFGASAPVIGAAHAGIDLIVGDPTIVAARRSAPDQPAEASSAGAP